MSVNLGDVLTGIRARARPQCDHRWQLGAKALDTERAAPDLGAAGQGSVTVERETVKGYAPGLWPGEANQASKPVSGPTGHCRDRVLGIERDKHGSSTPIVEQRIGRLG